MVVLVAVVVVVVVVVVLQFNQDVYPQVRSAGPHHRHRRLGRKPGPDPKRVGLMELQEIQAFMGTGDFCCDLWLP